MRSAQQIASISIMLAACVALPAQGPIAANGSLKSGAMDASTGATAVFVENRGQFDPVVRYQAFHRAGAVWLTPTGIVFEGVREARADAGSQDVTAPAAISEIFVGSNPNVVLEPGQPSPAAFDYLTSAGAARLPIRTYASVDYKDVWPGISVRLAGNSSGIQQEFIIQAGANSDSIAVTYEGIDGMTIDADGSLAIPTAFGAVRQRMPKVYREVNGQRIEAPGRYKLTVPGTYGFQLDTSAREYPIVIGPTQIDIAQSSGPATGAPIVNFFNVAPTSTLAGQAAIGTLSVSGATSATINGITAGCSNGECGGTFMFNPTSTTNYVLEANGAGGNVTASQEVEVGHYEPNPPAVPAGLQVTWQGACWLKGYPKSFCNGACQGMAFSVSVPTPPSQLPLEATLYLGSTKCNPGSQDNLNDLGTLTGSGGWIFWFTHHPNKKNTSAIWTIGNQSSGCVSYARAPNCQ